MPRKQRPPQAPTPMSLRAYGRRRGVSGEAVSKAITDGRLQKSVTSVGGQPKIRDPDLADREWEENTRPTVVPALPVEIENIQSPIISRAIREQAAARREVALADLAEIDVAEKREELVPVAEARAYMMDKFSVVRTRMLGVPSRFAQRMPHLAKEGEPVVEALIREVLEELSVDEDDGDGEDGKAE